MFAKEALSAAHGERAYDRIPGLEFGDSRANFIDDAREFMAHDEAGSGRLVAAKDMKFAVRSKYVINCMVLKFCSNLPHKAVYLTFTTISVGS
jgi:hypothetical protein